MYLAASYFAAHLPMQAIAEVETRELELTTASPAEEPRSSNKATKIVLVLVLGAILVFLGIVLGRVASDYPVSDHITDWI